MKHIRCILFFMFPLINLLLAQTVEKREVLLSEEVYFDFGKHELKPVADTALHKIADRVKGLELFEIKINAHTDSIGTLENNLALSKRRANAVKTWLEAHGISAEKVEVSFFGEIKPADVNATDEGRQRNRRATVEVIQTLPMITIEGIITDEKTGKPLVSDVIIRTKESRDSVQTDSSGYFKKRVLTGTVVGLDVFAPCYFQKSEMLKATLGLKPVNIPLKPALSGEKIDIENLYYVGNQAVLLESSKPELLKILRFMQLNPKMKIEVAGHVNFPNRPPVVKESFEYKLSVGRAKMVYDYLLENDIANERISYQGYGNWEMRFPKAISEEQQALNRRVEIRVLEGGCQ